MPYKDKDIQREKNRGYQKKYYSNNKKYYQKKSSDRKKVLAVELEKIKKKLKCEKCGEGHVATLDFHHKNASEKEKGVGASISNGWSINRIKKEIKKCIVLCSNCHRKLHYKERKLRKKNIAGQLRWSAIGVS
jgi:transcription elongation factor Elf1